MNQISVALRGLSRPLRQIAVCDLGHKEPTLFLTNDTAIKPVDLVERYAHRMLIENSIAENIDFFHLDALSRGAVGFASLREATPTLQGTLHFRYPCPKRFGLRRNHPPKPESAIMMSPDKPPVGYAYGHKNRPVGVQVIGNP